MDDVTIAGLVVLDAPRDPIDVVSAPCFLFDTTVEDCLGKIRGQVREGLGREIDLVEAVRILDAIRAREKEQLARRRATGFHIGCPYCFGLESDNLAGAMD